MSIEYLIDVLWILICLGGGFWYGRNNSQFGGPLSAGVGGLLAAVLGVIIVHVLLGPMVGTPYRGF